jgi:DNA modification methylase
VLDFPIINNDDPEKIHPTQKPVALMEWAIRSYTDPGATVLDFAMGSGTTGVAALRAGRSFIGIEANEEYATAARRRIENAAPLMAAAQ